MQFKRHFTNDKEDIYSNIKFQYTTSEIKNMDGSVVFKAENVETPNFWSQVATDILAQKYFRKAGVASCLKKVEENKLTVTAELRGEFAEKYEHDKANLTDAVDKMVSERIEAEMAEFAEDKKALAEQKVKYATQIREHSDKLKSFVFEQLKQFISISFQNITHL